MWVVAGGTDTLKSGFQAVATLCHRMTFRLNRELSWSWSWSPGMWACSVARLPMWADSCTVRLPEVYGCGLQTFTGAVTGAEGKGM